jgi:hypothetical protein
MNATLKGCAIAATMFGALALSAPPASANSLHNEGNFGGSYSRIAPSSSYGYRRHAGRIAPLHRGYYGRYAYGPAFYGYGPGYYGPGYYGPGLAIGGPGIGVY